MEREGQALGIFIIVLIGILMVVTYLAGGGSRGTTPAGPGAETSTTAPATGTPQTTSGGSVTPPPKQVTGTTTTPTPPKKIKLSIVGGASTPHATKPESEYLTIVADTGNTEAVLVSGLTLKSAISGASYQIPNGERLPRSGTAPNEAPVFLKPGERVVIQTGRSPIGMSFLINKCTGYFSEFQTFTPPLSRNCPLPKSELADTPDNRAYYGSGCFDFLRSLSACRVVLKAIPADLPAACHAFIASRVSYNGCVAAHRSDADFFAAEWRLFLGRDTEIWRDKREEITLVAPDGTVLSTYTY